MKAWQHGWGGGGEVKLLFLFLWSRGGALYAPGGGCEGGSVHDQRKYKINLK